VDPLAFISITFDSVLSVCVSQHGDGGDDDEEASNHTQVEVAAESELDVHHHGSHGQVVDLTNAQCTISLFICPTKKLFLLLMSVPSAKCAVIFGFWVSFHVIVIYIGGWAAY